MFWSSNGFDMDSVQKQESTTERVQNLKTMLLNPRNCIGEEDFKLFIQSNCKNPLLKKIVLNQIFLGLFASEYNSHMTLTHRCESGSCRSFNFPPQILKEP